MKIEIRAHFWPATPKLREIKLFIDGRLIESTFLNDEQLSEFEINLRHLSEQINDIIWNM